MKKVIVISIIIAAVAAVLAVCAVKTGLFKTAETEKPAVEQEIKHNNPGKPLKINPRIKMQKIPMLDKEKIRESLKKKRKENNNNNFNPEKKQKRCGE